MTTWYLYRVRGFVEPRLYIGITSQSAPVARLEQHIGDLAGNITGRTPREEPKWWAKMAAGWDLDPKKYKTEADALAAEKAAIKRERPRCNDLHNRDNPNRWRSMADVPIEQRPVEDPARPVARVAPTGPKFWTGQRAGIAAVTVIWLTVFGAFDWAMHNAGAAAVGTVVAFAVTWSKTGRRRRRRRVW